ncbi:uncharacterized protein LOC112639762 [Camponotus floridanus]|uniref:uncharacterized protein LOC112639762 n=1 Tax=Camponotus floridanus TaxID=104421 RepID=UPI000DC66966|nr:uncharacterized protein LOC112639762 [Camponotus floridanus]
MDINNDMCTSLLIEECCERRSDKVKFAIGLVVSFGDNFESKAGVIIGWHNKYQTEWFSFPPYQLEFECDIVEPYYIILIDNDIMCYVPQRYITSICKSRWIYNTEIGRYFCKMTDTHYIPNQMLAKHYPKDAADFTILHFAESLKTQQYMRD